MPNPDQIQRQIDRGRGHAARALGGPFNVYRIQANAATNVLDAANLVASNFLVYHLQKSSSGFRGSYEGTAIGVPLFDIIGDMTQFYVGDLFIDADAAYQPGGGGGYGAGATSVTFPTLEVYGWCLGFHGPIKKSIGARLDRLAQVYRLNAGPVNGYYQGDGASSLPVVLSNGTFSVGTVTQTGAFIPVGLAAKPRWRSDLIKAIPTTTHEVEYLAYVPPLKGFTFQEGDRLVLQDGSQYVVQLPWEQQVGFAGSQLSIKREVMTT